MNANLSIKTVALGLLAAEFAEYGLELPAELSADIGALIDEADEFAGSLTDEESDAAVIAVLTGMVADIKRELEVYR
jgi:hypothetical protein